MRRTTRKCLLLMSITVSVTLLYFYIMTHRTRNFRIPRFMNIYNDPVLSIVNLSSYKVNKTINCPLLRTAINGGKICPHPAQQDHHVSYWLEKAGIWEPHIVTTVLYMLNQCPECVFIDIGANVGVFTISVAVTGRKVIAVEPSTKNLEKLTESIRRSQVESNVVVVANALSERYQTLTFYAPMNNAGGTTAIKDNASQYKPTDIVKTVKMNDLARLVDAREAVIKIDIEGMEPYAIRGAAELFDKVDIKYVFMEWSGRLDVDQGLVQYMLDFFTTRGYQPVDVIDMRISLSNTKRILFPSTQNWPHDIVWIKRGPIRFDDLSLLSILWKLFLSALFGKPQI